MSLALLGLMLFSTAGFAARQPKVHTMNYCQSELTQVDGRKALRIEIGMDRPGLEFKAAVDELRPTQLRIDLADTAIGELTNDIKLEGTLARYLTFREMAGHHVRATVVTTAERKKANYRVYTVDADRRTRLPYRLVIEILEPRPEDDPGPEASAARINTVAAVKGHSIAVDAGHGGSDSGAVGPHGVREKDVTLRVARDLRDILQASGAHVKMTRDADVDVYGANASDRAELQARVDAGAGMEIFVSIHCNAFSSAQANGSETFYHPKSQLDARLAQYVQQELIAAGGLRDRGMKEANFYVVRHSAMPAILVELAFITNYNEERLLNSPDFDHTVALAIAKGLGRYFQQGQ